MAKRRAALIRIGIRNLLRSAELHALLAVISAGLLSWGLGLPGFVRDSRICLFLFICWAVVILLLALLAKNVRD